MIIEMKIKPVKKEGLCSLQYYDKDKKIMCECGKKSKVKAGANYVCSEHLEYIISNTPKADVRDYDGKCIRSVEWILSCSKSFEESIR